MTIQELALEMAKMEHKKQYERNPTMMSNWSELTQGKRDWWVKSCMPHAELAIKLLNDKSTSI